MIGFLALILLVIPLSVDALGVGLTYGIKNIKIPFTSKIIICFFSMLYSAMSLILGKFLSGIFQACTAKFIGICILLAMGIWFIIKAIYTKSENVISEDTYQKPKQLLKNSEIKTLANIMIKSLGITIQVIKHPKTGDIDGSGIIDRKESFLLGLALSVDSIGVGIGSAFAGIYSMYIPVLIGLFQLLFLCSGIHCGKGFSKYIPIRLIDFLPGIILIILSLLRAIA